MKKVIFFLTVVIGIFYILSEFVGDRIIKSALETNISNILDRETNIKDLKISHKNFDWINFLH